MSDSYAPRSGDEKMQRGPVIVEKALRTNGDAAVTVAGSLPTPCHQLRLRIPPAPSPDGVLRIEAWSVVDPALMCAQVLQAFSVRAAIPPGAQKVAINGVIY